MLAEKVSAEPAVHANEAQGRLGALRATGEGWAIERL